MKNRKIRIRIAVTAMMMVLTSVSLLIVNYQWIHNGFNLADMIQKREAAVIFSAASAELDNTFGRAPAILNKYAAILRASETNADDLDRLAGYFAAELRTIPFMSWISLATRMEGSFVGATWRGDNIIINMSIANRANGATQEWIVNPDGSLQQIDALVPERFEPRETEWFYRGYLVPGVSWGLPYEFREGGKGITAVKAIHSGAPNSWVGTMTADFRLDAITERLRVISDQFAGSLLLIIHGKRDEFVPTDQNQTAIIGALQDLLSDNRRLADSGEIDIAAGHNPERYFYSAAPLTIIEGLEIDLVYIVPVADSAFGTIQDSIIRNMLLSVMVLLGCLVVAFLVARSIARPLEQLSSRVSEISLDRINEFRPLRPHWLKEINQTRQTTNDMVAGLRKGEEIRSTFGRYIPEALASALEKGTIELELGGHEAHVTAMFTDIEGFTTISETYPSDQLVTLLNRYFAEVLEVIEKHHGMVVDFIGDGLFAIFGAPVANQQHSDLAITCALDMIERTEAFERQLAAENISWGRTRIGLNTGRVIAGNVGGAGRQKYTALGDVVNTAARIEGLNKQVGTRMLAASTTLTEATVKQTWRSVGVYRFVGKANPLEIFEAVSNDADPTQLKEFATCLAACRRNAPDAAGLVDSYTAKYGEDKVLTLHRSYLEQGQNCDVILLNKK